MNAYDLTINAILQEIDKYSVSDLGEVEIDSREIDRFPDPEEFTNPKPDIEWDGPLEGSDILGSYRPMSSPGVITLYPRNLSRFFWSMVKACYRKARINFMTKPDMERVLHLVVTKTYQHELFHFGSDVLRNLYSATYDQYEEEALAVAYSRLQILSLRNHVNSEINLLSELIYNTVLKEAFCYTSPGYRDWVKYPDKEVFMEGLIKYFNLTKYNVLIKNGVNVGGLIYSDIGNMSGYSENVVPYCVKGVPFHEPCRVQRGHCVNGVPFHDPCSAYQHRIPKGPKTKRKSRIKLAGLNKKKEGYVTIENSWLNLLNMDKKDILLEKFIYISDSEKPTERFRKAEWTNLDNFRKLIDYKFYGQKTDIDWDELNIELNLVTAYSIAKDYSNRVSIIFNEKHLENEAIRNPSHLKHFFDAVGGGLTNLYFKNGNSIPGGIFCDIVEKFV